MCEPVVDSRHLNLEELVKVVTELCFRADFRNLCNELERIYRLSGSEKPTRQAFQDALYTLMVQEEVESFRVKLLD
ncbi:MAG TPA: hypothetical protein VHQ46_06695 [Desulfobacteria bacterium]|nr:hypothetical protein [Desulfobacteria bacterium]